MEGFKVGIAGCKVLPAGLLIGMLAGLEGAAKKNEGEHSSARIWAVMIVTRLEFMVPCAFSPVLQ